MDQNCKSCNEIVTGNFCINCGQPAHLHKIDKYFISHEISHALHFEKGFMFSAKELLVRPATSIKEFIYLNRNKHMKPAGFLLLSSLIFTVIANVLHADEVYNQLVPKSNGKGSVDAIMGWVYSHWGYTNLFIGFFIALCLKSFFKKYEYNFFEILIMLCFILGEGMLVLTFVTLFISFMSNYTYILISSLFSYGYTIWAIGQFFDKTKITSYIKAFFAYFFGTFLFFIVIFPVGIIADLVIKIFH